MLSTLTIKYMGRQICTPSMTSVEKICIVHTFINEMEMYY